VAERDDRAPALRQARGERDAGIEELRAELERLRSQLRQAEARAEHAERLATIGRLLTGLVHELNNPLTTVTMYAEALASRTTQPAEREKALAILEAGGRLYRLSRELVHYARPAAETSSAIDLGEVVDHALKLCRPELKAADATVEREPGTATVLGSREGLVQVVFALVSNASRASAAGGRIRVALATARGYARLTVADEGSGMTDEVRARAFEAFFTTRPGDSLGLGLSTAKAIVERLGGRIELESQAGSGTTVTVVLPEG
jgi:signal transduction histidine kinase